MNAVANDEAKVQRDNERRRVEGYIHILRRAWIVLENNFIYIGLPKAVEHLREFVEVFYCPFYPECSPVERVSHFNNLAQSLASKK